MPCTFVDCFSFLYLFDLFYLGTSLPYSDFNRGTVTLTSLYVYPCTFPVARVSLFFDLPLVSLTLDLAPLPLSFTLYLLLVLYLLPVLCLVLACPGLDLDLDLTCLDLDLDLICTLERVLDWTLTVLT